MRTSRAKYWASKAQCDRWLLDDMRASCNEQHHGFWQTDKRVKCRGIALYYNTYVRLFGRGYKKPHEAPHGTVETLRRNRPRRPRRPHRSRRRRSRRRRNRPRRSPH